MSKRIQVTGALGLERALDAEQKRLHASLVRLCRSAAAYGRTQAMGLARASGMRVSGTYERSFIVGVVVDGAVLANTAEHADIIENGRRPGARPPPVGVILMWMMEKGLIPKMPGLSQRTFVARALKIMRASPGLDSSTRRRIRGKVEENARAQRQTEREKFILAAWRRAWTIAKNIGRRGMKPRRILGQTVPLIQRYIKTGLRKIGRGQL